MYKFNGNVVANMILPSCIWLAREQGLKTKNTESIIGGYWVAVGLARGVNLSRLPQFSLERVNDLRQRLGIIAEN